MKDTKRDLAAKILEAIREAECHGWCRNCYENCRPCLDCVKCSSKLQRAIEKTLRSK